MKVYKEKQFLVFELDDGSVIKYDFAKKHAIGKSGKVVKNLNNQLRNYSLNEIFKACDNPNYVQFLDFVKKQENNCYNIGTLLSRTNKYTRYEQFFSAGIGNNINGISYDISFKDLKKGFIQLCKNYPIPITDNTIHFYNKYPNQFILMFNLLPEYITLDENDLSNLLRERTYKRINGEYDYYLRLPLLLETYHLDMKSFMLYLDRLKTFEGIEVRSILGEIEDYYKMMNQISPDHYDKYPRNFLTTHQIASRNYHRFKKEFNEELFKRTINNSYALKYKDYIFIVPQTTEEIKQEAIMQNNCVASYIDSVIEGDCSIIFLRKNENLNKSFITCEVKEVYDEELGIYYPKIVQAKRAYNEDTSKEDDIIIDVWEKTQKQKRLLEKQSIRKVG